MIRNQMLGLRAKRDGVAKWNSHSVTNCSGVTFQTATRTAATYDSGANAPYETVWFFRGSNTEFFPRHRFVGGMQEWEVIAAKVSIQSPWGSNTRDSMKHTSTHELGHGYGLRNETFPASPGRSIMGVATQITSCDTEAIRKVYCPVPSPTPTPTPEPDECDFLVDSLETKSESDVETNMLPEPGCCYSYERIACQVGGGVWDAVTCTCISPIVIDVAGNGFNLTNAQNGVLFDILNHGTPIQVSWTAANSDDAWLALDRNGNGTIDRGKELFGSSTPQPFLESGESKSGFRALAVFDKLQRGGNLDGKINAQDSVFSRLRLWRDANHNGVSEANELYTLPQLGLRMIDLDYEESTRHDQNGNWFRYRAKVRDAQGAQLGRWAWDVFLQVQ